MKDERKEARLTLADVLGIEQAPPLEPDGPVTCSELGNARRLVAMYGDDIRHCKALPGSGWLIWDGNRWAPDHSGQVVRWVKRLPEVLRAEADTAERQAREREAFVAEVLKQAEAQGTEPPDTAEDLERAAWLHRTAKAYREWAPRCETAGTIRAALGLLETESSVPVVLTDLDRDPWQLGTPAGLIDLRDCSGRPAARSDLITRTTGAPLAEDVDCPRWQRFLLDIMGGDEAMVSYLQRAVGYSLIGVTSEQVLFVCHGSGANGKSTFLETVRHVLGDYARNCPADSFVGRKDGTIPNDLAMLAGARLVTASETAEGKPLDEALVKALTGGEPITARYLNREFFEFQPQFTIWLATNHKPRVKGTDHGIWRRIHLVPFAVTIDRDKMDRALGARLRAEGPGILRWAVEGARAWQEYGLCPPATVLDATNEYRTEQDVVAEFLDQCCVLSSTASTPSADLYAVYAAWCRESGEYLRSARWFGGQLTARGVESGKGSKGIRIWRGIGLGAGRAQAAFGNQGFRDDPGWDS